MGGKAVREQILSVGQLNEYIKMLMDGNPLLSDVLIRGEISNFTNHYKTGHFYMTIKDEFSSIKAVMFKTANMRLKFMPENSMSVIIKGRVSVFERDGQYQLYIDDMQPDAARTLADELKAKAPDAVAVFALTANGKLNFLTAAGKDAVAAGVHAGKLVSAVAAVTGGKGGGRPDNAMAGGADSSKIADALAAAEATVLSMLK